MPKSAINKAILVHIILIVGLLITGCEVTASTAIKDQKDKYDEAFFEENMLICAIETSSTDKIRNTLATYYVFVAAKKSDEIQNIEEIQLYDFER